MLCTGNAVGASRFRSAQFDGYPVKRAALTNPRWNFSQPALVVLVEVRFAISRLPSSPPPRAGRTIVRVFPGARLSSAQLSNEPGLATAPEGAPLPDSSKAEQPPVVRRADVVAFALVS